MLALRAWAACLGGLGQRLKAMKSERFFFPKANKKEGPAVREREREKMQTGRVSVHGAVSGSQHRPGGRECAPQGSTQKQGK